MTQNTKNNFFFHTTQYVSFLFVFFYHQYRLESTIWICGSFLWFCLKPLYQIWKCVYVGKKAHTGKWSASRWVYYSYMMWCKSATRETLLFDPLRVLFLKCFGTTIKRCSSRLTLFANLLWVIGIFSRANCLYTRTSTCDKNSLPAAHGFDIYA